MRDRGPTMGLVWMQGFDFDELVRDWHPPLPITLGCGLTLLVYLRGFLLLRRTRPEFSPWRVFSFALGLLVLWLALASPLEELADTVLTAHMVEHLLLMSAVPPLVWLGWPAVPLLRGLPAAVRRWTAVPLLRSRTVHAIARTVCKPWTAWLAMNATLLLWHIPAAYDFALKHEGVHDFEHICFLATSLLFWWVLLQPWPARQQPLGWLAPVYLVLADVVNTVLSAMLAFVGHPVYRFYLDHPNPLGLDPVDDQTLGASIMWVFGSLAFLLPAGASLVHLLQGGTSDRA